MPQDDSLAFPQPIYKKLKATKCTFIMKYTFCFYYCLNYARPIRPMHFDFFRVFFALSIYFFVHPLCGRVAHFSRSIVIIICTFSDFFSR